MTDGGESREPARIRAMFGGIAGRYDLLNHLLSACLDRGWRRAAASRLPAGDVERVLDLCGGTGDLALEVARLPHVRQVICCDFSHEMLERARAKFGRHRAGGRCVTLEADGLRLPFADATFDAVTVGFGVRNFACLENGLREIHRVLRSSGRMVVLEFSRPDGPVLSRLYRFYRDRVLPRVGDTISGGRGAYGYLARTIADFPEPDLLAGRIRESGFAACEWSCLSGGIVAIHAAIKR